MLKFICVFVLIFVILQMHSIIVETASFQDFLYWQTNDCEYDNWISHISEGIASENYNIYSPWDRQTNGFGDFLIADDLILDNWYTVIDSFLHENYQEAQNLIDNFGFPYQVVEFNNTDNDRTYYLLREILDMNYFDDNGTPSPFDDEVGSFNNGWGLYIFNPQSQMPIIITAPHSNDDFITPALSYKCFSDWDAMFLLISGAGREVEWTQQGSYSNSKSLSDPSRAEDHVFNVAYKLFCDKIRRDFGQREFSAQIHSYDWNKHSDHPNCQISAGYNKGCPNLPIRDISDSKIDIINASNHLMIPSNTIGTHPNVYLNDYYSVNYDIYDFIFESESGRSYPVNNRVDLEGYSQNRQMLYSFQDWNRYDVFEPFFHLEMDELPNCYEQNEENYFWFYSYNPVLGTFNMSQLFENSLQYYSHWINAATEILPAVIELDDYLIPESPENFSIVDQTFDTITLEWDTVSSFDFETYEILYSTEPVNVQTADIFDRYDNYILASQLEKTVEIPELELNQIYFFRIRAKDYNDNYSELSEEIYSYTAPVIISDFEAIGKDNYAELIWTAQDQLNNQGFIVYRKTHLSDFIIIDSWETNPALIGSSQPQEEFIFTDTTAVNGAYFFYKISSVNSIGMEFFHDEIPFCSPQPIYYLYISNNDGSIADTVAFSKNPFATNEYDEYYDIEKTGEMLPGYIYAAFYESSWGQNGMYLSQETHGNYHPFNTYKTWNLQIATDQLNQPIQVEVSPNFRESAGKLYLRNNLLEEFTDLNNNNLYYFPSNSEFRTFILFWGNLYPHLTFNVAQNSIHKGGDDLSFSWSINYKQLVEHLRIYIKNDSDSVMITNQTSIHQNSYTWNIQDNLTIHNANIYIDMITIQGEIYSSKSPYKIGIIPSEITLQDEQGWHLVSNPWNSNYYFDVTTVFGEGAELYLPIDQNEFELCDNFQFGQGYWLYADQAYSFSHTDSIQNEAIQLPLHKSWNLLANPHACSYKVEDLKFLMNEFLFSFTYMFNSEYISQAAYIYRDGTYQMVDKIEPFESFYLYVNLDNVPDLACSFIPYNSSSFNPEYEIDWELKISASQFDTDELIIGISEYASDGFDFNYDLPEPASKPFNEGLALYIPKPENDTLYIFEQLNSDIRSTFHNTQPESKIWNFKILIPTQLEPVTIHLDFTQMPEGYFANMNFDGNIWNDLVNEVYIYSIFPSQTGTLNGEIEIMNDLCTAEDNVTENKIELINYPNPFNPTTTIYFTTNNLINSDITIYNIKGQKINSLDCDKSLTTMSAGDDYSISWDGTDNFGKAVASGIYFIRLETNGKSKVRKALLIK